MTTTAVYKKVVIKDTAIHVELLSPREHDVIKLISQGYSNRQIGKILSINFRTIERHTHGINKKLAPLTGKFAGSNKRVLLALLYRWKLVPAKESTIE